MTKRKFLGGNPELVARLRSSDTDGAIKEINKAIDDAGGDVKVAADKLGIAKRTLFLWASDYEEISNALKRARKRRAKTVLEEES